MNLLKSVLVVCIVSTGCLFMPSKAMKHCDTEILRDKFFDAIRKNNVNEMQLYLAENPAMINRIKKDAWGGGHTPLHYAVFYAHYEAIEFLLKNGADINGKSTDGYTPLLTSFPKHGDHASLSRVELLLKNKANVNFQGKDKKTILHRIVGSIDFKNSDCSGIIKTPINEKFAQMFLEAGADSNIRDTNYRTPLFTAVLNKRLEIAKACMEHGGDKDIKCPNWPDNNYMSSTELAILQGDIEFAKYMQIYAPNNNYAF